MYSDRGNVHLEAAEAVTRADTMRCCTAEGSMEGPSSSSCSSPSPFIVFNGNGLCNAGVNGMPTTSDTVADDHGHFIKVFEALCLDGVYILSELDRIYN